MNILWSAKQNSAKGIGDKIHLIYWIHYYSDPQNGIINYYVLYSICLVLILQWYQNVDEYDCYDIVWGNIPCFIVNTIHWIVMNTLVFYLHETSIAIPPYTVLVESSRIL